MKKILIFTLLLAFTLSVNAQFDGFYQQGQKRQKSGNYYPAIQSYTTAMMFANDKPQKEKAQKQIDFCANKLNLLKIQAQEANKKTNRILKALLPKGVTNIYKYFADKGDENYNLGKYEDAVRNYELAKNSPDIPKENNIDTKFKNAKKCAVWQKNALDYLYSEKYDLAEQEILKVLKINPNARKSIIIASAINPIYSLVLVQGGEFMMGSEIEDEEKPIHKVSLSTFEISQYEVTNLQYAAFLNKYGSNKILMGNYKGEEMVDEYSWGVKYNKTTQKWQAQEGYEYSPIVNVTWYGANEYCKFYNFKLPSEAQWEYAARGGKESFFNKNGNKDFIYSGSNNLDSIAWYSKTSKVTSTFPVGLLKPNQLGIYDMSGNVWEWCADWYDKNYYQECYDKGMINNPQNETINTRRVLRGGSWDFSAACCRVANRTYYYPSNSNRHYGFRFVFIP